MTLYCNTTILLILINQSNRKKKHQWCHWVGENCSDISIVFVLIVAIDSANCINCIDHINRIDPGVLNCSALQLEDNSNDPTNSGMTFWGKKGGLFEVTGIYWNLQIFHEVCLKSK